MLRSLKLRLTLFTISLILVFSLIIGIMCYGYIYQRIVDISVHYNNQVVNQLCNNIKLFLADIDNETQSLSYSTTLRTYSADFLTPNITPSIDDIKKAMWNMAIKQKKIDDITLVAHDRKSLSLFNMYDEKEIVQLCNYYKNQTSLTETQFVPIIQFNNNKKPALSCVKSISAANNYYIVTSISISDIFEIMNDVDLGVGSGACLVDSNGSVQYSTYANKQFMLDMNQLIKNKSFSSESNAIVNLNKQKYILSVYPLSDSNLSTVVYIPLRNVTDTVKPLLHVVLGVVLLLLVLAIFFCVKLSDKLTEPITVLANHFRTTDNYQDTIPMVKGTSETDTLWYAYQKMVEKINLLLETNAKNNKMKRKAEIMALQAQINPHFLYNTLDSINAMSILHDNEDISNMTTSLAHLLRLSINQPDEFVTINDEIEHVNAYLRIQKIRYNDKFDVKIFVENEIKNKRIIRLILQPLVENSIYHGLEEKDGKGHIQIDVHENNPFIVIRINDNGLGVDHEEELIIKQNLANYITPGGANTVGLYNVNERLRLYYGQNAALDFNSIKGQGTVITLTIPEEEFSYVKNLDS